MNPKILDHAQNPRNWGELEDANGVMINVQDCGDIVMFFIKVENMVLEKVNFLVQGCHNLIACCSMLTVLTQGRTIWEAMEVTPEQVIHALDDGLPPEELHAASYACDALYGAIQNYLIAVLGYKVTSNHPPSYCGGGHFISKHSAASIPWRTSTRNAKKIRQLSRVYQAVNFDSINVIA